MTALYVLVVEVGIHMRSGSESSRQPRFRCARLEVHGWEYNAKYGREEELKRTGVSVTPLCPGLTRTNMVEHAKQASPLARQTPEFLISDARAAAREGVDACLSGRVPPLVLISRASGDSTPA